jgi:hypothetical protein
MLTAALSLKHDLTDRDSLLLRVGYFDAEVGDVAPRYQPAEGSRTLRIQERQEGSVLAGYHHEWTPDHHTLVLAGRYPSRAELTRWAGLAAASTTNKTEGSCCGGGPC